MSNFIKFIGDIHGKMYPYACICDMSAHRTIQVGDYGMGFPNSTNWITDFQAQDHRFIRGNHDDPAVCKQQKNYIADGTIEGNMMLFGGADSIDKAWRTEGYSWWADEQLSMEELQVMIDLAIEAKPEVLVTHEAPDFIANYICSTRGWQKYEDDDRTRKAIDMIYQSHRPKLHVFGHWHIDMDIIHEGTRFICLNELSSIDIDLDDPHNPDFKIVKHVKFS